MAVGALARMTGVSTATVNYYVREGLLPRPRKTARTRAFYAQFYVDRIRRIKSLQERGLPLRVIRTVLDSPSPGQALGLSAAGRPETDREAQTWLAASEFLAETGLSRADYTSLVARGLVRRPRRAPAAGAGQSAGAGPVHDRRDIAAGQAFAALLSSGVTMDVLARHTEYEPLSRAEAHFLAEHVAVALRQGAGPGPETVSSVLSAFDVVRRYQRLRQLDVEYPGWAGGSD